MIQKQSYLNVADNSGAKSLQCININGSTGTKWASIGDIIVCAVKSAIPNGVVKKGDVVKAVIVRTCKEVRREDGSYIRFGDNAAIIIKPDIAAKEMLATRVFGPIARELRNRGFLKVVSLAPEVL
jgi:large subunit ribosomal protein L14